MNSLQNWINKLLINWGIIHDSNTIWDNLIIFSLIILVAFLIDYICKFVFVNLFKQFSKRTKNTWDDLMVDKKLLNKAINIIPAIFVLIMLPVAFSDEYHSLREFLARLCVVYIIAVSIRLVNAVLNFVYAFSSQKSHRSNPALKGLTQALQIVVICIGVILIIAVVVDKSPTRLLAGLGASAAVLSLVFKDTLMGLIAGVQLSMNDMVRVGDWIEMPNHGVNGFVIEVSLITVKVQNWDKTIVTVPPYSLISDSFQNWRGMFDSGGRRVKRSIYIDLNSVKFCTSEMLEKFKKISLITEYIEKKETELKTYNEENHVDESVWVNGRRQTNLGVFRAYIEEYLKHDPRVNLDMFCMVRQLQPTEKGLPLELYFFVSDTRWVYYEAIMADVFDHIFASVNQFDLRIFQGISGSDIRALKASDPAYVF